MRRATMLRLLAAISLLVLAAEASNTGRELLASGSSSATIGVTLPTNAACKFDLLQTASGLRSGCSPCSTTGNLAYNVNQNTALTINFKLPSTGVLIGGSYQDQFLANGNGCMMSVNTAPATGTTLNGVNASSITSITFAPTQSVCTQFTGNTKGELSFLAFDTKGAVSAPSSYKAEACKFTVTLTLLPNALSSVSSDQLFPQADAADALPGSFLKMAAMAVLGGGLMLTMLL